MAGSCTKGQWLEKHQKRVGSLKQRMLQKGEVEAEAGPGVN